jgi:hypothetical protein
MQANTQSTTGERSHLSIERRDIAFSLHSKYTVVRRVLHIVCLVIACYSLVFAIIQFKALSSLQSQHFSAIGNSENRVASAKHFSQLLALQLGASAFQDPVEQETLLDSFVGLDGVVQVSIFNENGLLIASRPEQMSIKSTLANIPDAVTATAKFKTETGKGMVVLVVDDLPFKQLQTNRTMHLTKGILATLALGFLGGVYGFRSVRRLRPKTRS